MTDISGTTGDNAQDSRPLFVSEGFWQQIAESQRGQLKETVRHICVLRDQLLESNAAGSRLFYQNVQLRAEIAELRRPLWQKAVQWLARFG